VRERDVRHDDADVALLARIEFAADAALLARVQGRDRRRSGPRSLMVRSAAQVR
jgi:hypothetical protein